MERALRMEEHSEETVKAVGRMVRKLTFGQPVENGCLHRATQNSGDTGPYYLYTVVEYLSLLGEPDPPSEDYVKRLGDFIWERCLDNSQLREAGHRAAVPSVALRCCPEHVKVLYENQN